MTSVYEVSLRSISLFANPKPANNKWFSQGLSEKQGKNIFCIRQLILDVARGRKPLILNLCFSNILSSIEERKHCDRRTGGDRSSNLCIFERNWRMKFELILISIGLPLTDYDLFVAPFVMKTLFSMGSFSLRLSPYKLNLFDDWRPKNRCRRRTNRKKV